MKGYARALYNAFIPCMGEYPKRRKDSGKQSGSHCNMKRLVAHTILQWFVMPMEMMQYDSDNSIPCDINNPIEIGNYLEGFWELMPPASASIVAFTGDV